MAPETPPAKSHFFPPDERLQPYVSMIYHLEVNPPDGSTISDYLHPEWGNLRFVEGQPPIGALADQPRKPTPQAMALGPTCHSSYFESGPMRLWGIGMLPLGWCRFVGHSAEEYADRVVDIRKDTVFRRFRPLQDQLFIEPRDDKRAAAHIVQFLHSLLDEEATDDPLVEQAHKALHDPEIGTVAELAERLGISGRSVDRLSRRAFGFPPKLLLRRQRFLRTLGNMMLDPNQKWGTALDSKYYDQAHFARDFRRFMGMTAREYMALPHPILGASVFGRMESAGAPMQVLEKPGKKG